MSLTLGEIAVGFGCELHGDPDIRVRHVGTLTGADNDSLAFLANPGYRPQLQNTRAAAVILAPADLEACQVPALVSANPYLAYAQVAARLHPPTPLKAGIHAGATVAEDCVVPASCEVRPGAVLESGVRLGERVLVGANAVVGRHALIGDDTVIMPGVIVHHGVTIGARCIMHPGAIIGADGFGNARAADGSWVKVPQIGSVRIGDDVEIGSNSTVDRGAIDDTVIHDGVRIDNLVQIGHNVVIGAHTALAAMSGVSGSTVIGERCIIGGRVSFAGHLTICDQVVMTGGTNVISSIERPGIYGGPASVADDVSRWRRNAVRFQQLDEMARRLRRLEKRAAELFPDD